MADKLDPALRWYTTRQVAAMFQVSLDTVQAWLRGGRMEGVRPGARVWRVSAAEVARFMRKNPEHAAAAWR